MSLSTRQPRRTGTGTDGAAPCTLQTCGVMGGLGGVSAGGKEVRAYPDGVRRGSGDMGW